MTQASIPSSAVRVVLASALARWIGAGESGHGGEVVLEFEARRLDRMLDALFAQHPKLRGYVLDEHGHVRHHVAVFVDGESIRDKQRLDVALRPGAEIYLMQALSGG